MLGFIVRAIFVSLRLIKDSFACLVVAAGSVVTKLKEVASLHCLYITFD